MNLLKRALILIRGPRFRDYEVQTGHTRVGNTPFASLEEFFALVGTGATQSEAIGDLEKRFDERIRHLRGAGDPIPLPGSGKGRARFAASDRVEDLRPFVDEFWEEILETSYSTSFVSDESRLAAWEHYVPGGRQEIVRRVRERYGVEISTYYDEPLTEVLQRIRGGARRSLEAADVVPED